MQRPKPMPNTEYHLQRGRPYICKFSVKKGRPLWYSTYVEELKAEEAEAVREHVARVREVRKQGYISLHLSTAEEVLDYVEENYTEKRIHAALQEDSFTTRGVYLKLREWHFSKAEAYVIADSQPRSREEAVRCLREWKDGVNSEIEEALSELTATEKDTYV